MTRLAGVDLHQALFAALSGADFPVAALRQGGVEWKGRGFSDGTSGVFIPEDSRLRPRAGDRFSQGGRVWNVSGYSGSEDAWEFDLDGEVEALPSGADFEFELTALPGGVVQVLTRVDPALPSKWLRSARHGRWRVADGGWTAFRFDGDGETITTSTGGLMEVDVWLVSEAGEAGLPMHRTVEVAL